MASAARIMIAATASGGGKTTLTCGLLQALIRRGLTPAAGKCGPDYLDPMFHRQVLGTASHNLDLFLAGEDLVRSTVAQMAQEADITLIEGVMGYYDGIAQSERASAYEVARVTETPAVLVVDGRGRALSAAAEVCGFARFRTPSQVAGVILNRVSPGYYPTMKALIEREAKLPVLGYVPQLDDAVLASRHLGLVSAPEVADLRQRIDVVAAALEETIDLDQLLQLARTAPELAVVPRTLPEPVGGAPLIAVAQDEAFSFYYPETLALFEQLGARLIPFSPLRDAHLPAGAQGLYLGGGYPELHARALSANETLRRELAERLAQGLPTIAECGGFLYLQETLCDEAGTPYPMVGAVPGQSANQGRLGRFGYLTLTAAHDNLLTRAGEQLRVHEFHYWGSDHPGASFSACKPGGHPLSASPDCVVATDTLYAGFPHLYLNGCPTAARRFVGACAAFGGEVDGA